MAIELYSLGTANGDKIHLFLEETGVPYNAHTINVRAGEQFHPELLKLSPNNKIPAIYDPQAPNGKDLCLFESGAILIYLADKYQKLIPPANEIQKRAEVIQWLMWQVSGIGPMFGQLNHFDLFAKEKIPYAIERYTNETRRLLTVLDIQLKDKEWVAAGEYTIADIAIFPWVKHRLEKFNEANLFTEEWPNVRRWFTAINARPAVERATKVCRLKDDNAFHTFPKPDNWENFNVFDMGAQVQLLKANLL